MCPKLVAQQVVLNPRIFTATLIKQLRTRPINNLASPLQHIYSNSFLGVGRHIKLQIMTAINRTRIVRT